MASVRPGGLHPAARILLWCGWAVTVERAAQTPLIFLAVAAATAFLFAPVRLQLLRLLRRTRWLLLVLLLTYAYLLPGTAWWPALGWASPALEGVQQGVLRVGRLALMLAGLALLLASTSRPRLIYGLYVLAWPLTWLGFDRRAFAVRLGLTLDYVERAPKPANWLDALRVPLPDEGTPTTYTLEAERWQSRDSAVILVGLFGMVIGLA
ncbi:MAG: CbiQ family ECF transporter T component [Thiobacillus sp.]|uniref:CbiQ family ECF transporter T component n=1 Tax=Thiobacillus sp. TaxID=924 RepID=UPI002733DCB8|nr:CbiQ family ECF transporter T component [Thiobacillus sp.]MDP3584947.1 CbiQ family ECF transporter T component [Thiobacillus sp.]